MLKNNAKHKSNYLLQGFFFASELDKISKYHSKNKHLHIELLNHQILNNRSYHSNQFPGYIYIDQKRLQKLYN